jgi:hypothetical protein
MSVGAHVPSVVEHAGVDVPTVHEWHWPPAWPQLALVWLAYAVHACVVGLQHPLAQFADVQMGTQAPLPSHTLFVPHDVPAPTLLTFAQTGAPVPHWVVPLWHLLPFGLHVVPVLHATQPPAPLHTLPVPHPWPAPTFERFVHVDAPVAHDVVPVLQRLPGGKHWLPAVHETQPPSPSHTRLVPHWSPGPAGVPKSWHVRPPSAQIAEPLWQGSAGGAHDASLVHAAHVPLLQ